MPVADDRPRLIDGNPGVRAQAEAWPAPLIPEEVGTLCEPSTVIDIGGVEHLGDSTEVAARRRSQLVSQQRHDASERTADAALVIANLSPSGSWE